MFLFGGSSVVVIVATTFTIGRYWVEIFDKYQKKSFLIKNNPYKQVTDHIFVMKKFMESHGIKEDLPVIPIIAIWNKYCLHKKDHPSIRNAPNSKNRRFLGAVL